MSSVTVDTAGEAGPDPLVHWEGEPVSVLETLWGLPRLTVHGTLGSTNDQLSAQARAGALPFTAVLAEEQTEGRGRAGKAWSSPRGLGLWLSILLGPAPRAGRPLLPLLVGLAVCRAVDAVLEGEGPEVGARAGMKWPNDILLGGRKVCGILCESVNLTRARSGRPGTLGVEGVVAGIGLNVSQLPENFPPEVRRKAVSLAMVAGGPVSRKALVGRIIEGVRELTGRPTLRLEGRVAEELAHRDILRDRRVEIDGGRGRAVRGVARGMDPRGRLLVEGEDGVAFPVVAGSIRILDPAATRRPEREER